MEQTIQSLMHKRSEGGNMCQRDCSNIKRKQSMANYPAQDKIVRTRSAYVNKNIETQSRIDQVMTVAVIIVFGQEGNQYHNTTETMGNINKKDINPPVHAVII